ncbi:hypothetical protein VE02_04257 [Pseudogymnoascus sp. 03VT05]|nr:hypothetical protein VE02_04257 [Pseudogymnoascus sp. 03VT05]
MGNIEDISRGPHHIQSKSLFILLEVFHALNIIHLFYNVPTTVYDELSSTLWAGGTEMLKYSETQSLPELNEGEVLVKNTFAEINFVDIYYRTGVYPSKSLPDIIGNEAAGTIVAIREPNPLDFKIGDRVAWMGRGGYAEYTAVNHATCVIIPSEVSDRDAASVLLMGMTALSLVKKAYAVQKSQTVLVHAAAGGVGLLMCLSLLEQLEVHGSAQLPKNTAQRM